MRYDRLCCACDRQYRAVTYLPGFIRIRWQRPGPDPTKRSHPLLSPEELTRVGDHGFIQGRMLLRTLAGELLGLDPVAVPLSATCPDCGRPHGQPRISGLTVSLARCATAIVAVAALEGSVGVDVEPLDGTRERDAAIADVAGGGGIRHWTSVEAALKADGRGLRVDPRNVVVTGAARRWATRGMSCGIRSSMVPCRRRLPGELEMRMLSIDSAVAAVCQWAKRQQLHCQCEARLGNAPQGSLGTEVPNSHPSKSGSSEPPA